MAGKKKKKEEFVERQDIIIDGNTATFDLKANGLINGTYMGSFRFRCYLSPLQQIAASREYRELMGSNPSFAAEHESFLAYALTQLKHRIITAPPFWTTSQNAAMDGDIADESIITLVLDAAVHAEMKYKNQLQKKREEATKVAKDKINKMMEADDEDDEDDEDEP